MIKTGSCSKSTRLLSAGESSRFPALSDFNFDHFLFFFFAPFWNGNEHDERDDDPMIKEKRVSDRHDINHLKRNPPNHYWNEWTTLPENMSLD